MSMWPPIMSVIAAVPPCKAQREYPSRSLILKIPRRSAIDSGRSTVFQLAGIALRVVNELLKRVRRDAR